MNKRNPVTAFADDLAPVSFPLRLHMPLPPSLWNLYEFGRYGRQMVPTVKYETFKDDAGWIMKGAGWRPAKAIDVPFVLDVAFERPTETSDLDNRLKALLDVLKHYGIIADDRLCERLSARWATDLPAPCVVLIQPAEDGVAA